MSLSFPIRSNSIYSNPFRFLLYTEWGLVATFAIVDSLRSIVFSQTLYLSVPSLLILIIFGLMGLILPRGQTVYKVLYTGIEVGLILFGAILGYLQLWPLLLIVVVIRSCFLFDCLGRYLVAALTFFLFLVLQAQSISNITLSLSLLEQRKFWLNQFIYTILFGVGLLFLLQLVNMVLVERQLREQLTIAHKQLQQYIVQVEDLTVVRERNHIAHNIHDSLGHALAVINIQLQSALKFWQVDLDQAHRYVVETKQLGSFAMQEVRRSVNTLRVDVPKERSLHMAIAFLVREFHHVTGILPTTQLSLAFVLPLEVSKILYRLVQEALTNIHKHAEATTVNIHLSAIPEQVYLTIEDNGKGFQLDQQPMGFGLQEMQERVALLKGQFQIESKLGSGCCITVRLPLSEFPTNIPQPLELASVPNSKNSTLQKSFVQ
ncbi:MAG: sensor histidine kinase [Pelatocladus maniniholoensis HA4357-MV3]|jgi:signal transduction histidine kinase|uniref:histidine kinase n=1 Tax=Pelatocladus maniniholoensis HA4357-MV3 TaxID=1117104 RepID=A0A9E3H809_9NOST|nr:sensor histidine kinase [Pelatocladus maniniholoensis HA4357-MV3]BAZ65537.1 integral membrane sensor signal transduction histidine kinase [Fischerella sp. NIES-4106]